MPLTLYGEIQLSQTVKHPAESVSASDVGANDRKNNWPSNK